MRATTRLLPSAFLLVAGFANAAPFTFDTPDFALPDTAGDGLTGQLWINVDPATDSLAAAQAIIDGGDPDANFLSTNIDYPSTGDTASTSATYDDVLDAVGKTTIDNTSVLSDDVLNTVMRFAGFFAAEAGEIWTFRVRSDDGSAVDIQGTRILDNDGIRPFGGPSVEVEFTTAGLYALDVLFFESQPIRWGLTFDGGADGSPSLGELQPRLYNLFDYADPDDPRLPGTVPEPGTWGLLALAGLVVLRRRRA